MLRKLLPFELKLQAFQIGFWVTVLVMFAIGLLTISVDWLTISIGAGERVKANGANTIASQIAIMSIASLLFAGIFVVTGVMRDEIHKMMEIVHATPVKTRDIINSRLIGVTTVVFFCTLAVAAGLFIGQFMPWIDKETLGPIHISYFLYPLFLFGVLNAIFVTVVLSTIAGLTRNRMMVYVGAIAMFMAYMIMGIFTDDAPKWVASLLDPFGINGLALETEYWPADEQNTRLLPLNNYIGLNRLLWAGITIAIYLSSIGLFKRGIQSMKVKAVGRKSANPYLLPKRDVVVPSFNIAQSLQSFWARLVLEYKTTILSRAFLILILLAIFLAVTTFISMIYFDPSPTLPTSAKMAQLSIGSFGISMILIIIFFSGEMAWRDRLSGMEEIIDSGPVRNWHMMAGKWLGLVLSILTIILAALVVGMIVQLILGGTKLNLGTYLKIGFLGSAPNLILMICLAMFIQNFTPNRIVGMFVVAAALIFFSFFVGMLPFYHPLMDYGYGGIGQYSEINGFSDVLRFKWFGSHWYSLALLFAVISIWIWRRGTQISLFGRIKNFPHNLSLPTLVTGLVALSVFVSTGLYIYRAYDRADYRNPKAREVRAANYEKLLKDTYTSQLLPKIRSVHTDIDFIPSQQNGVVSGEYVFENVTGAPISELFIEFAGHPEDIRYIDIDGAERRTEGDHVDEYEDYGYWVYDFKPALEPGETRQMRFETFFHAPRLGDDGLILKNGTFVNNEQTMPQLGVESNWLQDPDKRRKYDLPELDKRPNQDDMKARQFNFFTKSADYVDFSANVCTEPGQVPIAPGQRLGEETVTVDGKDRYCRSYKTIKPIMNFVSFLSANYVDSRDVVKTHDGRDLGLTIYYDKPHDYNVKLMMQAMKDSIRIYTEKFSPYPYHQVRIMEFPYASFAQSFAGTIPFSENIGFVQDPGDPDDASSIDLATYVTMHEIGHQWFGHQIVPADTKGFNILSEGLTEYAAYDAYQDIYGWNKARKLIEKRSIDEYLTYRALDKDSEPALINAEGQSYLYYQKASWIFWGMKQYIGEEKLRAAVAQFISDYGYKGPPYPTTFELVAALREAAGEDYQQLITDYWERITFWELSLPDEVTVTEKDGQYEVSFTANVDKKIAEEKTGRETSVNEIEGEALNEWVEVGFYAEDPKEKLGGDWTALERVRITQADTPLTFTLKEKPSYVLLDPRRLLQERNVDDNVKKVKNSN